VSVANEIKPAQEEGAARRWRRSAANAQAFLRLFGRKPRTTAVRPTWRAPSRLAAWGLLMLALVGGAMALIDAPSIIAARGLPDNVILTFVWLTDFGTSDWFLVPLGLALAGIAAVATPALAQPSRAVLAALAVRLAFVFAAIALPGLVVTIGKRLIGRARPFVGGHEDPFLYHPLSWTPDYASLPSGHATNVFAALVAVGLVWPRMRLVMLFYALIIAASRVIVWAHHPSDVIAGAAAGIFGALLVRDWFAARGRGFAIGPDGKVATLPGPSWRRLMRVARQIAAP
jgi:undecaprenyl-diphosphatase